LVVAGLRNTKKATEQAKDKLNTFHVGGRMICGTLKISMSEYNQ
jgi:hypothetical protein